MERKIGEIFESNGEWYQCVESQDGSCKHCDMNFEGKCPIPIKECTESGRSDKSYVIFKKLEKVGEPYTTFVDKDVQNYLLETAVSVPPKNVFVLINNEQRLIAIEIKQNKEDMEEIEWKTEKIEQYSRVKRPKISGQEELNLKPFDLEATKQGKPVCTRDGRKARIICFDAKGDYPIIALIDNTTQETDLHYSLSGRAHVYTESEYDLMMLPEKKEGWVNIYRDLGQIGVGWEIFPTKEKAIENFKDKEKYITTIKIGWEE